MVKLLDCTLRDGGYYTNWDFKDDIVDAYFSAFNSLPVDYLEIGYRNEPEKNYLGRFFYCPTYLLERLKQQTTKDLVIILNEKSVPKEQVKGLLSSCVGILKMVRLAIDPKNFKRAIGVAEEVKALGFEVGFNVMYMSSWAQENAFLNDLEHIDDLVDYFYMVDSYGGVYPEDVANIYDLIRSRTSVKLGFHGHNNMELGLVNTIKAIELGADIVDATVTGMGRGAGNLKTELLLTYLSSKHDITIDYNALSQVVDPFTELQAEHGWGTNLAYMVSGAYSLPQKDVMNWVSKRYYSFNSIIRALSNKSKGIQDNENFPALDFKSESNAPEVLIVGGGPSTIEHFDAIERFLSRNSGIPVIHASSKNAQLFKNLRNKQYFCLIGNEGHRLEQVFEGELRKGKCILPPYPREMGTYIPEYMKTNTFEIKADQTNLIPEYSHTSLALQAARELGAKSAHVVGYDGYAESSMKEKEHELFLENELLFEDANQKYFKCMSLVPTRYKNLISGSIYTML